MEVWEEGWYTVEDLATAPQEDVSSRWEGGEGRGGEGAQICPSSCIILYNGLSSPPPPYSLRPPPLCRSVGSTVGLFEIHLILLLLHVVLSSLNLIRSMLYTYSFIVTVCSLHHSLSLTLLNRFHYLVPSILLYTIKSFTFKIEKVHSRLSFIKPFGGFLNKTSFA